MFINNPNRIGMNYFSYDDRIRQFVLNKILFLTGAILCHVFASELLLCIATVVMLVPVVKKVVSEVFSLNFCSEALLIVSATMLCISWNELDSAVIFLIIYHIFDAVLYVASSIICKEFNSNSLLAINPVSYRKDSDGNYVLSNNEFVPSECVVIRGNASVATEKVSGIENDFIDAEVGTMLLPSYRIISGNLIVKPVRENEKSLKSAVIEIYSKPQSKSVISTNRIMTFSIGIVSILLLFLTSLTVFGRGDAEWIYFSMSITLLMCVSPMFLFEALFEYSYLIALAKHGIHIVSHLAYEDISIIEGDKIFTVNDITSFGYYSHNLPRSEASLIINRKKKILSFKISFIFILFILNIVTFFVFVFTEMLFPSVIAVIATAFAVAILSRIN